MGGPAPCVGPSTIQRRHDPSLGFRYSCRVGMCGTCTLRLDGRSVLACQTLLAPDRQAIRLDPRDPEPRGSADRLVAAQH